ncbi:MAG: kinase domain protein [Lacunisphaera sp.]|nr:kinase domain protein [Lacunisphaera sp.]
MPTPPTNEKLVAAFPEVANLEEIARGGFKIVYDAQVNGQREAFKLLALPAAAATETEKAYRQEYIGRAKREIELLGKCATPELVKLGSLVPREVTIDGVEYLGYSEEFLVGPSVQSLIGLPNPLPTEADIREMLISLLKAIKELWSFEVVHRDIKPLNIIKVAQPGRPYVLLDLGIAYHTREPGLTIDPANRFPPATIHYLAPEMLRANFRQALDFRSDIYTAGVSAFEYATHQHPLKATAEHPLRTISRVIRQNPTPLKSIRSDFSDAFCRLIDQMLKKSPPLRPGNLTALIARLEAGQ